MPFSLLDRLPAIGKPATVTCELPPTRHSRHRGADGAPGQHKPANGDLAWQGIWPPGNRSSVSATVIFDAGGDTTVLCRTLRQIDAKNSWGDLAALYLSVGQTATREGFAPVPPAERIHLGGLQHAGDGTLISEDQAHSVPRPRARRLKPRPG